MAANCPLQKHSKIICMATIRKKDLIIIRENWNIYPVTISDIKKFQLFWY